ncbi:RNA polymerase sigma factor SigJ [Streptomyces sp. 7-21]|uniref:RNA polymerase sigma factor SigJ n=1 Tax=Streptomyces sp. 7-21 TaxID=2802283 RepID=UPI0027DB9A28|nr:RNA polymerase sigma factor SigJ [Streptomyces sp. 7-21]
MKDGRSRLAAEFTAARPRLMAVAYGMLGTVDDAEDVVQESWLRLSEAAEREEIRDVTGWLVVAVARLAMDHLKSARVRRERYVGPWLPEPVVAGDGADPADRITLDESLSMAMLVVLESLTPAERTSFLLHDVFGLTFPEVARAVGRTPAACRQLAARARGHLAARAPRVQVSEAEHRRVVAAFATAVEGADYDALLELLDPEVVLRADGGGRVLAARRPVLGSAKTALFISRLAGRYLRAGCRVRPVTVNGSPGLAYGCGDDLSGVAGVTVSDGRVTSIDLVRNPEKLRRVPWDTDRV